MPMSLAKLTLKGSLWNFASNSGQQVLTFLFFIFLARLLDAKAFGLVAMALVSVEILGTVARLGLTEVMVQRKEESPALVNLIFWVLQGTGMLLCVTLILMSGALARWFGAPELQEVVGWFAFLGYAQNLSLVHEAKLRRHFKFKSIAMRTFCGTLAGGLVGVGFALNGYGVMSLVMQRLTTNVMQTGILWSADDWRPSLALHAKRHWGELRRALRMGTELMLGQLVLNLNTRMVDVMVGFFMGPVALGYLRIAWRIFDFILQFAINPVALVALTTFSRLQHEPARLRRAYLRMVEVAALGSCPVFFGLAAVAPHAVPLMFGAKWLPAVPLMQAMSLMALAAVINVLFAPLMTAVGRTDWLFRQGVVQVAMTLALTAIGAQWSVLTVVLAHALRAVLTSLYNLHLQGRFAAIEARAVLGALFPPFTGAVLMGVTVWQLDGWWIGRHLSGWPQLIALVALGGILYAGIMLALFHKHLRGLAKEILPMLRASVKSKAGAI